MSRLRITLQQSTIGAPKRQKETARILGLSRPRRTVIRPDTPAVRGMVERIGHLVTVEEIEDGEGEG